jgi:hypothetical protein
MYSVSRLRSARGRLCRTVHRDPPAPSSRPRARDCAARYQPAIQIRVNACVRWCVCVCGVRVRVYRVLGTLLEFEVLEKVDVLEGFFCCCCHRHRHRLLLFVALALHRHHRFAASSLTRAGHRCSLALCSDTHNTAYVGVCRVCRVWRVWRVCRASTRCRCVPSCLAMTKEEGPLSSSAGSPLSRLFRSRSASSRRSCSCAGSEDEEVKLNK